eukprot:Colp12_sorted_trinity150504_noHs@22630
MCDVPQSDEASQHPRRNLLEDMVIRRTPDLMMTTKTEGPDAPKLGLNPYRHKFVLGLWSMLEDPEANGIIEWSPSGDLLLIYDVRAFEGKIMPKYFNTCMIASFKRQMNIYNFKRVTKPTNSLDRKKFRGRVVAYSHPLFRRDSGKGSLLKLAQQKKRVNGFDDLDRMLPLSGSDLADQLEQGSSSSIDSQSNSTSNSSELRLARADSTELASRSAPAATHHADNIASDSFVVDTRSIGRGYRSEELVMRKSQSMLFTHPYAFNGSRMPEADGVKTFTSFGVAARSRMEHARSAYPVLEDNETILHEDPIQNEVERSGFSVQSTQGLFRQPRLPHERRSPFIHSGWHSRSMFDRSLHPKPSASPSSLFELRGLEGCEPQSQQQDHGTRPDFLFNRETYTSMDVKLTSSLHQHRDRDDMVVDLPPVRDYDPLEHFEAVCVIGGEL